MASGLWFCARCANVHFINLNKLAYFIRAIAFSAKLTANHSSSLPNAHSLFARFNIHCE